MSKLNISDIQEALKTAKIEPEKQKDVLDYLQDVIKEQEADKAHNALPKQKNEFGVILYDADNQLVGKEFTASVFSVKQGDDFGTILTRISDAAKIQNESAKKKNNLIQTIGSACQNLKRKFIKEKGINIKTKEPVRVLITNNKIV